jgi:hypothetical protein
MGPFDELAFPSQIPTPGGGTTYYTGMLLRDWFAGQAMLGFLSGPGLIERDPNRRPTPVARLAYEFADAMLAERLKAKGE